MIFTITTVFWNASSHV